MKRIKKAVKFLAKICTAGWAVWLMAMLTAKAALCDPITGSDVERFIISGLFVFAVNLLDIACTELYRLLKVNCPAAGTDRTNR